MRSWICTTLQCVLSFTSDFAPAQALDLIELTSNVSINGSWKPTLPSPPPCYYWAVCAVLLGCSVTSAVQLGCVQFTRLNSGRWCKWKRFLEARDFWHLLLSPFSKGCTKKPPPHLSAGQPKHSQQNQNKITTKNIPVSPHVIPISTKANLSRWLQWWQKRLERQMLGSTLCHRRRPNQMGWHCCPCPWPLVNDQMLNLYW